MIRELQHDLLKSSSPALPQSSEKLPISFHAHHRFLPPLEIQRNDHLLRRNFEPSNRTRISMAVRRAKLQDQRPLS